jgi:GABA(A) receptor-associated protein
VNLTEMAEMDQEVPEMDQDTINRIDFRKDYTLDVRRAEGERIISKYPERIPVIVQRSEHDNKLNDLEKYKFLVPKSITMGMFQNIIRKRIKIKSEIAMFIFIDNQLMCGSDTMGSIYEKHKGDDEFLLVNYTGENTFGR